MICRLDDMISCAPEPKKISIIVEPAPVAVKQAPAPRLTVNSGDDYGSDYKVLAGPSKAYNNCYAWVQSQRSVPRTRTGNAGTTPTNAKNPSIGAAAVMKGHIAIVVGFDDKTVTIHEANYRHGYLTERKIPRSVIYGYVQ